jgi:hypothetical protein
LARRASGSRMISADSARSRAPRLGGEGGAPVPPRRWGPGAATKGTSVPNRDSCRMGRFSPGFAAFRGQRIDWAPRHEAGICARVRSTAPTPSTATSSSRSARPPRRPARGRWRTCASRRRSIRSSPRRRWTRETGTLDRVTTAELSVAASTTGRRDSGVESRVRLDFRILREGTRLTAFPSKSISTCRRLSARRRSHATPYARIRITLAKNPPVTLTAHGLRA